MALLRNRKALILGALFTLGLAWIALIIYLYSPSALSVQQIAFSAALDDPSNEEIYLMKVDGTAPTNLTNHPAGDRWPNWSPDGRSIAFCSDRDGRDALYVMSADGSSPRRLLDGIQECGNPNVTGLTWSPDSRWIATSYSPDGPYPDKPSDVYLIPADGSQIINLTDHPAMDRVLGWSPDSQRVSFSSDRDGNEETYVINIDGAGLARLTDNPGRDSAAVWSPDGSVQIYAMNPDGSGQVNLSNSSANDSQPAWLPGGEEIAFISDRDGQWKLYRMKADGSGQTRVTASLENETAFWWSADGKMLALNSFEGQAGDPDARWTSWIMNADGTDQRALPALVKWVSWQP